MQVEAEKAKFAARKSEVSAEEKEAVMARLRERSAVEDAATSAAVADADAAAASIREEEEAAAAAGKEGLEYL